MNRTERYYWAVEDCKIITEQELRADYEELRATDCDFRDMYATFEQYVESCCSKNGGLQLLRKGPGQFNSDGGNDVEAVLQFTALVEAICSKAYRSKKELGCDVKIIVDGYMLEAYDHAALMQGILDAVYYYADEIS